MREATQREGFIIASLINNLPRVMEQATRMPNHCIAATAVAVEVFKRLGMPARPTPVNVSVFNDSGWKHYRRGLLPPQWPEEAWSVGVGYDPKKIYSDDGNWNGHLIVRLPELNVLIDFNCSAISRPKRGIVLEPHPLRIDFDQFLREKNPFIARINDTVIIYQHVPENTAWKSSPDWLGRKDRYAEAIDWVASHVIENLEET